MDIKSLIKKIPNFEELVTQIENNYNHKNIVFSNDLSNEFDDNNVFVFLCRYREFVTKDSNDIIIKSIAKEFVNAYSNTYLETIAKKNNLFLKYVGEQKQGFCLVALSKIVTVQNESNDSIDSENIEIESITPKQTKKSKKS